MKFTGQNIQFERESTSKGEHNEGRMGSTSTKIEISTHPARKEWSDECTIHTTPPNELVWQSGNLPSHS